MAKPKISFDLCIGSNPGWSKPVLLVCSAGEYGLPLVTVPLTRKLAAVLEQQGVPVQG